MSQGKAETGRKIPTDDIFTPVPASGHGEDCCLLDCCHQQSFELSQ